jgi:hypothetical protein
MFRLEKTQGNTRLYFVIFLQQDLLGDWVLVQERGRVGGQTPKASRDLVQSVEQALDIMQRAVVRAQKRGFQLVEHRSSIVRAA